MTEVISSKASNSLKWSSIAEIAAKLISPITSLILAKIVDKEFFGVVAALLMVVSFLEIFATSGLCDAIIQKKYPSKERLEKSANVAFSFNFIFSIVVFLILIVFSKGITNFLVEDSSYQIAFIVLSFVIITNALSTIQQAMFKRFFDFKKLFIIRISTSLGAFLLVVPVAILLPADQKYWAIILSSLLPELIRVILFNVLSKWKYKFNFDFKILKEMLAFSIYNLLNAIVIWLAAWIDFFLIQRIFDLSMVGEYRNATNQITHIISIIGASMAPVALASFSRLKNNKEELTKMYYRFQRISCMIIIPLCVGVSLYAGFVNLVLLSSDYIYATDLFMIIPIGLGITVVFSNFASYVFVATGRPWISMLSNLFHVGLYIGSFYLVRYLAGTNFSLVHVAITKVACQLLFNIWMVIIIRVVCKIKFLDSLKVVLPTVVCTIIMVAFGFLFQYLGSLFITGSGGVVYYIYNSISIVVLIAIYFGLYYLLFKKSFADVKEFLKQKKISPSEDDTAEILL